jgi:hypothetical protein
MPVAPVTGIHGASTAQEQAPDVFEEFMED